MSVQGPSSSLFRPLPEKGPARAAVAPLAAPASSTPAAAARASAAPAPVAAEARPSTLWDILTEDERAYFTQQAALGSATYRPARTPAAPQSGAPTGQRIDVRA